MYSAQGGDEEYLQNCCLLLSLKERDYSEDPVIDVSTVLKRVLRMLDECELDLSGSYGPIAGCFECGNELSYFIKWGGGIS
jgi:hypothetical protein